MEKDDLWLDSCAYIHAAQTGPMHEAQQNLKEDICALHKIKELYRGGKIKLGISVNVKIEIKITDNKVKEFWKDAKPAFYPQSLSFQGAAIPSECNQFETLRAEWESRLATIAEKIGDYGGKDTALLINCAFHQGIFITTDYKFLNKLRNEGQQINFLKALRPSVYIEKYYKE